MSLIILASLWNNPFESAEHRAIVPAPALTLTLF